MFMELTKIKSVFKKLMSLCLFFFLPKPAKSANYVLFAGTKTAADEDWLVKTHSTESETTEKLILNEKCECLHI